jgi:hypothetical protein
MKNQVNTINTPLSHSRALQIPNNQLKTSMTLPLLHISPTATAQIINHTNNKTLTQQSINQMRTYKTATASNKNLQAYPNIRNESEKNNTLNAQTLYVQPAPAALPQLLRLLHIHKCKALTPTPPRRLIPRHLRAPKLPPTPHMLARSHMLLRILDSMLIQYLPQRHRLKIPRGQHNRAPLNEQLVKIHARNALSTNTVINPFPPQLLPLAFHLRHERFFNHVQH